MTESPSLDLELTAEIERALLGLAHIRRGVGFWSLGLGIPARQNLSISARSRNFR